MCTPTHDHFFGICRLLPALPNIPAVIDGSNPLLRFAI